jgi:hypothetical protein
MHLNVVILRDLLGLAQRDGAAGFDHFEDFINCAAHTIHPSQMPLDAVIIAH